MEIRVGSFIENKHGHKAAVTSIFVMHNPYSERWETVLAIKPKDDHPAFECTLDEFVANVDSGMYVIPEGD